MLKQKFLSISYYVLDILYIIIIEVNKIRVCRSQSGFELNIQIIKT